MAIVRNKIYGDPYLGLADALMATGHTEEALAQLEAGVKEAPADPSLLTGLGEVLLKAGRSPKRAPSSAAVEGPTGWVARPWGCSDVPCDLAVDACPPADPGRLLHAVAGAHTQRSCSIRTTVVVGRNRGRPPPADWRLSGSFPARPAMAPLVGIGHFAAAAPWARSPLRAQDGLLPIVSLAPEASLAVGLWHSAAAREELNAEL
jgi:hypothetical protein